MNESEALVQTAHLAAAVDGQLERPMITMTIHHVRQHLPPETLALGRRIKIEVFDSLDVCVRTDRYDPHGSSVHLDHLAVRRHKCVQKPATRPFAIPES